MILSIVAGVGSILCIICAIPQLLLTIKQGNIKGISPFGLYMKCLAAFLMTVYAVCLPLPIFVIIVQLYNDILCFVQLYYCFFPTNKIDPGDIKHIS